MKRRLRAVPFIDFKSKLDLYAKTKDKLMLFSTRTEAAHTSENTEQSCDLPSRQRIVLQHPLQTHYLCPPTTLEHGEQFCSSDCFFEDSRADGRLCSDLLFHKAAERFDRTEVS